MKPIPEPLATSTKLQAENLQLREQLSTLIEQVRRNEDIMRRHQEFDLAFISASSFRELIESIFDALSASSKLDVVTLVLLDSKYEVRRILEGLNIDLSDFPNLFFAQDAAEFGHLRSLKMPELGPFDEKRNSYMFPAQVLTPASVAVVPLWRHHGMIGLLGLGSLDRARFQSGMATDFLEHKGSIVAICLENVINIERLKHLGLTDPLTGVNNRRYVTTRLAEEVVRTRRHAGVMSCIYIDIDHFKKINDTYGHQSGDDVLREVASRIKVELRLSDTLGRFGGEEFVALLPDTHSADATQVAERVRAGISGRPFMLGGQSKQVTASIGVATLRGSEPDQTAEASGQRLVARADQALYQAKESGRNRVCVSEN
ncbi:MAG: sensor domain-containing diguanylate cyclase [Burkholderiaceae bacterium]|nr:sensor domain-containing diguanylate cyclase [Burkholderiaceae bacterium]